MGKCRCEDVPAVRQLESWLLPGHPWVFYMKNNLFTREDAPQDESTIDMQSFPTERWGLGYPNVDTVSLNHQLLGVPKWPKFSKCIPISKRQSGFPCIVLSRLKHFHKMFTHMFNILLGSCFLLLYHCNRFPHCFHWTSLFSQRQLRRGNTNTSLMDGSVQHEQSWATARIPRPPVQCLDSPMI